MNATRAHTSETFKDMIRIVFLRQNIVKLLQALCFDFLWNTVRSDYLRFKENCPQK